MFYSYHIQMKIDHVAIWVNDLEAMCIFYRKYFKVKTGVRYHNASKQFTSYFLTFDSGCRLELMHRVDIKDQGNEERIGLAHLAISLGGKVQVNAMTEQLRADGFSVIGEPRTTGDGYYESVILDPEGNRIELTV